jgi:anti-sigma-K factor RskA
LGEETLAKKKSRGSVMKYGCNEIRERMPDVAAGFNAFTTDESQHLASCAGCTEQLKSMRATMALMDEWQVPEPSPYFDTRLQARLREEMAKPAAGWLQWFRRPVLAAALTVMMGVGVGLFVRNKTDHAPAVATVADPERGTAVADLQDMEQNHDLYADYEVLDDLDVAQDQDTATP